METENLQHAAESVRESKIDTDGRPRPEWVRGKCPKCGDDLVSNCYYIGGSGYMVVWECWSSLSAQPTCDYRHIL